MQLSFFNNGIFQEKRDKEKLKIKENEILTFLRNKDFSIGKIFSANS